MVILMKNKRLICDSIQKNKAEIRIIVFYFRLFYNNIVMQIFSVIIAASVLTIGVGAVSGDERGLNIRIVISENANSLERAAAEFLRDTVRESTNIEYPIITDSEGKKGFEIAVGKTRRFDYDVSSFDDGGYVIKSYDGGIAVVGAGNRGNIYGVCSERRRCFEYPE